MPGDYEQEKALKTGASLPPPNDSSALSIAYQRYLNVDGVGFSLDRGHAFRAGFDAALAHKNAEIRRLKAKLEDAEKHTAWRATMDDKLESLALEASK